MSLNVPKDIAAQGRSGGLTEAEVGRLQERECDMFILNDTDNESGRVESIGEEEEGEQVGEGIGQSLDLAQSLEDLFPAELRLRKSGVAKIEFGTKPDLQ
jgi:hypothetical protein